MALGDAGSERLRRQQHDLLPALDHLEIAALLAVSSDGVTGTFCVAAFPIAVTVAKNIIAGNISKSGICISFWCERSALITSCRLGSR